MRVRGCGMQALVSGLLVATVVAAPVMSITQRQVNTLNQAQLNDNRTDDNVPPNSNLFPIQPGDTLLENSSTIVSEDLSEDDAPLACVADIKEFILAEAGFPQPMKDTFVLLTAFLTPRAQRAYYKKLDAMPVHIKNESMLQQRLDAIPEDRACWRKPSTKLGICTTARRSGPFIQEFLVHHILVGVTKVVIYNNDEPFSAAAKQFTTAVQPFVDAGFVDIHPWHFADGDTLRQLESMNDCLGRHRNDLDWIALIDVDEFIILHDPPAYCMTDYLANRTHYGALALPWVRRSVIGVPIHDFQRTSLEQYQYWPANETIDHVKMIANTNNTAGVPNPHYIDPRPGFSIFNPLEKVHQKEKTFVTNTMRRKMEIRHFWGRDLEFTFFEKLCGDSQERRMLIQRRLGQAFEQLRLQAWTPDHDNAKHHQELLAQVLFG